jgi:type II secretory pathway component GspD/PulD (secretin)
VAGQNVGGVTNEYPTVNEASLESIARVPSGYSLVLGGFYQVQKNNDDNKVPVLGDIPVIKVLFNNKSHSTTKTNLVFILTPETYEPTDVVAATNASERMSSTLQEALPSLVTPEQKWQKEYVVRMRSAPLPKGVSEFK